MAAFSFCPRCGAPLARNRAAPHAPQTCAACGTTHYHNSKPCAGAVILRDGRVLLGQRAVEPHRGDWDIPGGFLEPGEHPRAGARREVKEETGLEVALDAEPFAILIDYYGHGDEGDYTLNIYYLGHVIDGEPRPADDVAALSWFSLEALPPNLAFSHCRELFRRLAETLARPD